MVMAVILIALIHARQCVRRDSTGLGFIFLPFSMYGLLPALLFTNTSRSTRNAVLILTRDYIYININT